MPIKDIAEILLEEGNVFVKDVAIILTNSQDINQLTNISSQIIRKWRRKLEKDHYLNSEELHDMITKIYVHLSNIYNDTDNIDNLKGAIVEVYTHKAMIKRYDGADHIEVECKVKINGWRSDRSVDVGVLKQDSTSGDCFECKLGLGAISDERIAAQIQNLRDIHFKSNEILKANILSFEKREAVIDKLRDKSISFPEITIYGRNELHQFNS